jgi:hypothetical protein
MTENQRVHQWWMAGLPEGKILTTSGLIKAQGALIAQRTGHINHKRRVVRSEKGRWEAEAIHPFQKNFRRRKQ